MRTEVFAWDARQPAAEIKVAKNRGVSGSGSTVVQWLVHSPTGACPPVVRLHILRISSGSLSFLLLLPRS